MSDEDSRKDWIPGDWTFKNADVAKRFDRHVREQLPWYDLATQAVAHIGRHYIPRGGQVYDVGASIGNISLALKQTIVQRGAKIVSVEESQEMVDRWVGHGEVVRADALSYDFLPFDLCVCFLILMFVPVSVRGEFVRRLARLTRSGGALVIVDKINLPAGYVGTILRRLTMAWKVGTGTPAEEIVEKELSLAGYQRPVDPAAWNLPLVPFFQFGEFAGWILENPEPDARAPGWSAKAIEIAY